MSPADISLWYNLSRATQPGKCTEVLPGKKEEKEPLSWGRLISGAEIGVDLQSKQQ